MKEGQTQVRSERLPTNAGEITFPCGEHDTEIRDFREYGNCGEVRLVKPD